MEGREKRERNERIWKEYREGRTMRGLGEEYGISWQRVSEIVRAREREGEQRSLGVVGDRRKRVEDPLEGVF